MRKLIATFLLSLILILTSNAQVNFSFPCKSIQQTDSLKIIVSGLMDHNDLKVEWIKEEINNDSINDWLIRNVVNSLEIDPKNMTQFDSIIRKQVIDYAISDLNKMKKYFREGDRIFYYTTPPEYWEALYGQDGLIISRDCKIIAKLILSQS